MALVGLALGLLGSLSASFGNMVSLRNTQAGLPLVEVNALGMAWGALFSFGLALLGGAQITFDWSFSYVTSLLYLTLFGSVIAFGCYLTLIARIGADRGVYVMVLAPAVALLFSTLFEGYVWTGTAVVGIVLVASGNLLALTQKIRLPALRRNRAACPTG